MAEQTTGMFLNKEDEARFNSYTKEDIYKSYMTEYITRKKLEQEVIRLNRKLAEKRYTTRSVYDSIEFERMDESMATLIQKNFMELLD